MSLALGADHRTRPWGAASFLSWEARFYILASHLAAFAPFWTSTDPCNPDCLDARDSNRFNTLTGPSKPGAPVIRHGWRFQGVLRVLLLWSGHVCSDDNYDTVAVEPGKTMVFRFWMGLVVSVPGFSFCLGTDCLKWVLSRRDA